MASELPFEPQVKSAVAGQTVSLSIGAGAATSQNTSINSAGAMNPSLLVTFGGGVTAGTVAYLRLSVETSVTPTATATDTPLIAPCVHLFANPNPQGVAKIAVIVTATPATGGTMWFTTGQGGAAF